MDFSGYSKETLLSGAIFGGAAAAAIAYFYLTSDSRSSDSANKLVPGLANQGNTCYINSLLQALSSCPSFVAWLRNIKLEEAGYQGGFIDALREVIEGLNEPTGGILNAGSIVNALSAHGWNIKFGVEHDLYELFNVFVTTWEDELKNCRDTLIRKSIDDCFSSDDDNSTSSPAITRKLLAFKNVAKSARADAKLRSPCSGMTATEFRCCNTQCGYKTVKYESFTVLTLSIPNSQMGTSTNAEALLRRYFCSEIIRDAICDKCKATNRKQMGFLKKHGIVKLPQTLMIRIERVGMLPSGSLKLSEHVAFGECLSLQEVCFRKQSKHKKLAYEQNMNKWQLPDGTSRVVGGAEEVRSNQSPVHPHPNNGYDLASYAVIDGGSFVAERKEAQKFTYQLRAVSEHRGGPYSGHFVTYRRASAPNHHTWYCTNDSQVTRVTYSQVASCQSYMLFYERIRPHRSYDRA
ncbi:unnamed protein product [Caenorhabditis angaria]|uniref:Ubiquitin carboxyl-terminal hydrolase n=1 Tax=Caenorhabditis angaria TaxID=860376 RepID=A0A9P1N3H3_9PELO|nr:unnamed protein product [Caenorhabditis angaria]